MFHTRPLWVMAKYKLFIFNLLINNYYQLNSLQDALKNRPNVYTVDNCRKEAS